VLFFNFAMENM